MPISAGGGALSPRPLLFALMASLPLFGVAARATASAFVPTNDGQVLERLVSGPSRGALSLVRREREALGTRPRDLAVATDLARRYMALGRSEGDPRFYGFAQAALAPWWALARPPVSVLLLRAQIRQAGHEFSPALADLDEVLRRDPEQAQAWLTRAMILQTHGDYAQAQRSCEKAASVGHAAGAGLVCLWSVRGLQGRAREAVRGLESALGVRSTLGKEERLWGLNVAADLTRRLGAKDKAGRLYEHVLALQPGDHFLLAAYADLLLDMNLEASIPPLLEPYRQNGNLLLRLALAERRLGRRGWKEDRGVLEAFFAASRLRGDIRHLREEARFTLALQDAPARALDLALRNWSIQREPEDLRVLIESALAARDSTALATARDWLRRTGLEDAEVRLLLK